MDPLIRVIILTSLWLVYCVALILLFSAVTWVVRTLRRRLNTTQLLGPKRYTDGLDIAGCAAMYGPVFSIPRRAFDRMVVLCDGAATEHFYAQTPDVYHQTPANRRWTENMVGPGLAWVDGEQHEACRQVLSALFSNTAVEGYAPIFLSMANKVPHGHVLSLQRFERLTSILDDIRTQLYDNGRFHALFIGSSGR
uniref:Cytochrome P450 n=1 Tax=Mycena chlorophos TaxID=658473 RepID=A0ABQ0LDK7_MYCCL|nr:predicted protein [Mycena chlorophos]